MNEDLYTVVEPFIPLTKHRAVVCSATRVRPSSAGKTLRGVLLGSDLDGLIKESYRGERRAIALRRVLSELGCRGSTVAAVNSEKIEVGSFPFANRLKRRVSVLTPVVST